MSDTVEKICGATVQHGDESKRIYLMKIGEADPQELIGRLDALALEKGYSKIFAKLPVESAHSFEASGYIREATVPGFYRGREDACFMCRYLTIERMREDNPDELKQVLALALERQNAGVRGKLPEAAKIRICTVEDLDEMAAIYQQVFPSYPFPVHESSYLLETMRSHVIYFGVEVEGKLLALSSAEMDRAGQNVEMTDFATLPSFLGNGAAAALLAAMEPAVTELGIITAYTIARAVSPGMNITFARLGYQFGGRLINNTQISGSIESMNVWHKRLI